MPARPIFVEGAEVLRNPRGTAPGQFMTAQYDGERKIIILLPGPPWELEPLFQTECIPRLKALLPGHDSLPPGN